MVGDRKRPAPEAHTLTPDVLHQMDAYWRAANYLSVGLLLGHWGTTPGQNSIHAHLNRIIKKYDLDMIYVSGPGHGGAAVVGNTYLEGNLQRDLSGYQPG